MQVSKRDFERLHNQEGLGGTGSSGAAMGFAAGAQGRGVSPAVIVAIGVLAAAVVVLAALYLAGESQPLVVSRHEGGEQAAPAPGEGASEGIPSTSEAVQEPRLLYVHVSGAVGVPGVYAVPEGSRVCDAVDAAGGLAPDADSGLINLAALLADGTKVSVPRLGETGAVGDAAALAAPDGGAVNINVADEVALQALPGVGPALAAAIVGDREANGPFASPEDLTRVSGIGKKTFAKMAGRVVV